MSIIIYIVVFVLSLIVEMFLICLLFSCDYKMGGVVLWMNKNICWAGCVNIRIQKKHLHFYVSVIFVTSEGLEPSTH